MAGCRGCRRRQEGIRKQIESGLRMSADIAGRIRRQLNIGEDNSPKKYDNIRMTSEGVIKVCSQCGKESGPAPTAAQVPATSCENCK